MTGAECSASQGNILFVEQAYYLLKTMVQYLSKVKLGAIAPNFT
ncbi:MAG TPA: hypothetical protein VK211_01780 [Kamptonema sp.]|nr:hypothetical protein [Kamptonema sp.]